jgi:hypothetical protein
MPWAADKVETIYRRGDSKIRATPALSVNDGYLSVRQATGRKYRNEGYRNEWCRGEARERGSRI